jgi:hypothetical protein
MLRAVYRDVCVLGRCCEQSIVMLCARKMLRAVYRDVYVLGRCCEQSIVMFVCSEDAASSETPPEASTPSSSRARTRQKDNANPSFCLLVYLKMEATCCTTARLSRPQGHIAARRIGPTGNCSDVMENRTRDLPTCSIMPQPRAPRPCPGLRDWKSGHGRIKASRPTDE